MKLGLHIADFTWPDGAPRLGAVLADVATAADEAGFDRISVKLGRLLNSPLPLSRPHPLILIEAL